MYISCFIHSKSYIFASYYSDIPLQHTDYKTTKLQINTDMHSNIYEKNKYLVTKVNLT